MSELHFYEQGWSDYLYWQDKDRKTLLRINKLLKELQRTPFTGTGKPEPLKGKYSGYWSRRIDDANRIVYRFRDGVVEVVSCKGHYE